LPSQKTFSAANLPSDFKLGHYHWEGGSLKWEFPLHWVNTPWRPFPIKA
jgi:hypothetical protein